MSNSNIEYKAASGGALSMGDILKDAMTDKFEAASVRFIQEVKRHRGGEMASETIKRLCEVFGQDWANGIIYNFVAGDVPEEGTVIRVTAYDRQEIIPRIKEIRAVSWAGLKESKDAVEWLHNEVEAWFAKTPSIRPNNPPHLLLRVHEREGEKLNHIPNLIRVGFHIV